jgi:ribosomal protein S16
VIDEDRAKHWLEKGARPTKTVATLLRTKGIQSAGS